MLCLTMGKTGKLRGRSESRAWCCGGGAPLLSPGVRHARIGLLAAKRNGDFGTRGFGAVVASLSIHRLDVGWRSSPSVVISCPRRA